VDTQTLIRLIIGLAMTAIVGLLAAKRVGWLTTLISSGQPTADERGRKNHLGERIGNQIKEVFGQTKLLKWSIPGIAHLFTMWGFFVLATVYLEAYGVLFNPKFHLPVVGRWGILGFLQDFFAVAVLLGIITFAIIRLRSEPKEYGRASRFYGSHTGGAWLILFMIFNVIWTYALFRGSAVNNGNLPYGPAAFFSHGVAALLHPLGVHANEIIETIALLLHIGVMLVFLLIVLHSKHLHIGLAPLNVTFKRLPDALGPLLPMESKGELINFEDPADDAVFGRGKIEDFTWKGYLDLTTCTECGRCQSQCPAWNTGKPLSPKILIMDLRDHLFAKAPYILGTKNGPTDTEGGLEIGPDDPHHVPESGFERVPATSPLQATRPLVGDAAALGVIDPDVLWSCTTCGACVEQCPVDIEHIDHIVDMRRYQVMMESEFPSELSGLYKNLENKGNPWGQNAKERLTWIDEVSFDVPVYGRDVESFAGFEYLFWVGCAGSLDDRAKKTTKAVAELLAAAGVKFLVLGDAETCTGDSARRSGNEFLFQQLASQNVETINDMFTGIERVDRKVVVTCPHCLNTLGREYPQVGGNYTVLHHTQLLNRLVRDKKLIPVESVNGAGQAGTITYHDPCYLGRHNKVYEAPRELIGASGATLTEMPRHAERGFCCGAGGARMWMEEHIGKRVNHERVDEALSIDATKIATGCPFCRVMLTDGVGDRGKADSVEVVDVAQLLLGSLDRSALSLPEKGTAAKLAAALAPAITAPKAAPKPELVPATAPAPAPVATAPATPAAAAAPAAPTKGLGMAAGAKRPGAKKAAPATAETTAPVAEVTATAAPVAEVTATAEPAAQPVKGLGIAAGAKRPGAKKTAPTPAPTAPTPAAAAPAEQAPTPEPASEPPAAPVDAPEVKGLGIAKGARPPGKRG
jgi:Fe-S oxidoreductase